VEYQSVELSLQPGDRRGVYQARLTVDGGYVPSGDRLRDISIDFAALEDLLTVIATVALRNRDRKEGILALDEALGLEIRGPEVKGEDLKELVRPLFCDYHDLDRALALLSKIEDEADEPLRDAALKMLDLDADYSLALVR
jgi:hypothetical protein